MRIKKDSQNESLFCVDYTTTSSIFFGENRYPKRHMSTLYQCVYYKLGRQDFPIEGGLLTFEDIRANAIDRLIDTDGHDEGNLKELKADENGVIRIQIDNVIYIYTPI